jgi:hypothetical protein
MKIADKQMTSMLLDENLVLLSFLLPKCSIDRRRRKHYLFSKTNLIIRNLSQATSQ